MLGPVSIPEGHRGTTGKRFITFHRTPDAVFELAFALLARNGISRLWVIDPMHDMDGAKRTAEMAKRVGFEEVEGAARFHECGLRRVIHRRLVGRHPIFPAPRHHESERTVNDLLTRTRAWVLDVDGCLVR